MSVNAKLGVGFVALVVLLLAFGRARPSAFAADGTSRQWDAAVLESRQSKKPAVALFTADWCPSCRQLHDDVLSRDAVRDELNLHHTFVKIDMTHPGAEEQQLATRYGIHGIPTLIRFDADGNETDRTHGGPSDRILAWLREGR